MTNLYTLILKFQKVSFVLFLLSFCSCDTNNYVDYNLANSTSSTVKVTFNQWAFDSTMYLTHDTTFYLSPNQKKTLAVRSLFASGVFNPESGSDTIWLINKLEIYKNDTTPAIDTLKKTKYWNYNYLSRHYATLTLDLTDKYFR